MTGLDLLREEMKKRGAPVTVTNAKYIAVALDILANSGDTYKNLQAKEAEESDRLTTLRAEIRGEERWLESLKKNCGRLRKELEQLKKQRERDIEYIEQFNKSIKDCETAEGRDAVRIAQLFINSVSIDTKYDNTAYIIGLASILSKGDVAAVPELRKINDKIPAPSLGRL